MSRGEKRIQTPVTRMNIGLYTSCVCVKRERPRYIKMKFSASDARMPKIARVARWVLRDMLW